MWSASKGGTLLLWTGPLSRCRRVHSFRRCDASECTSKIRSPSSAVKPAEPPLSDAPGVRPPHPHHSAIVLAAVAFTYALVFMALDGLRFPLRGDETHFWPTALRFSQAAFPNVELLRSYGQLNTPLPFLLWGGLERVLGLGVFAARLLNFLVSFAIVVFLAITAMRCLPGWRGAVPAVGVLFFPYFLAIGTHAYTDMLPAALVLLGVHLHLTGRYYTGAAAFALAIAGRQYMVAFPVALLVFETLRTRDCGPWILHRWIAPVLAAATLGGWYLFFGGFGPTAEIADQAIVTARAEALLPRNSLYFLACVGLYFAAPMLVLTRTRIDVQFLPTIRGAALAGGMLLLFVLFPPLQNHNFPIPTMGYFDRALRPWLPDTVRILVFYAFALLAVVQLRHRQLAFVLLLVNAALMSKAHIAWDKYALPLIVVLWYLEAALPRAARSSAADGPPPSGAREATRSGGTALSAPQQSASGAHL